MPEIIKLLNRSASLVAVALIRLYQRCISPALGPRCRFYPSCSEYASECIAVHGILRGTALTGKRLCKCHPWHPGGIDLPPGR
ncbi:membrane protein insertion efficiency factor YidD [bacterium]|nr:membrane protein insertion efficiency factor YidD [bacterium]